MPSTSTFNSRPGGATSFDDDTSTASVWSRKEASKFASKFAPSNAPLLWGIINAVLFLWSLLLVLEISDSVIVNGLNHRLEASRLYMVWNFGTTIIWCLEVILTVMARAENNENWKDSWTIMLELIVAIYFTCDSIRMFRKWKRADDGHLDGELFDAIINMIIFFYLLIGYFFQRQRSETYELVV